MIFLPLNIGLELLLGGIILMLPDLIEDDHKL